MPFDLDFFKRKLEEAVNAHNELLEQEQAIQERRVQAFGAVLQAQAMAQEAEAAEKSVALSEDTADDGEA